MDRADAMARDMPFPPEAAMLPAPPLPANRLGFLARDSEDADFPGPIVDLVDPMSSAWDEGLRPGTRVLRLQGAPLTSAADLEEALEEVRPGGVVRLLLSEGNWGPSSRLVFLRAR
jgi:S1-C subfamily serine protease